MTENERIIKTQQRSLEKYERSMSEIRGAAAHAMVLPVDINNLSHWKDAVKRKTAVAITRKGEVEGLYIPIETLRKLGVVHG